MKNDKTYQQCLHRDIYVNNSSTRRHAGSKKFLTQKKRAPFSTEILDAPSYIVNCVHTIELSQTDAYIINVFTR